MRFRSALQLDRALGMARALDCSGLVAYPGVRTSRTQIDRLEELSKHFRAFGHLRLDLMFTAFVAFHDK